MKPSPIQILLLSFMAILVLVISGLLIFNPSFDGNIHLKSRVDPDDNSGEIHQVFVASRDIAKGEIVSVNDFQISERKQFSLDDKFIFYGSKSSKNLQIGNAVPPLLGEVIGKQIKKSLA